MAARRLTGGGNCILGCIDRKTGKTRKAALHSKTGICSTCLNNLSQKRHLSAPQLALARGLANTALARIEEVKEFPKGYARLGGRPDGKRSK